MLEIGGVSGTTSAETMVVDNLSRNSPSVRSLVFVLISG